MKRWALLALLLLCGPASAAFAPDVVNTTDTLATLRNIPASAAPKVMRLGYAAAYDAPPQLYQASATACSLNAGNGDNGSQVKSGDGKCWLAVFDAAGMDVRQFGAATSASDNTAAVNAALAAALVNGLPVRFGAGTYLFTGALTVTLPATQYGLTIQGAGMDASYLRWNGAGGGLTVNYASQMNSLHVRDLGFLAGSANATGTAVTLNQTGTVTHAGFTANSDFTNVTIRGTDGIAVAGTNYWLFGATVNSVSNISWNNFVWAGSGANLGTGLNLQATAAKIGVVYNVLNSVFSLGATGILKGDNTQGLAVTGTNITGSNTCINQPATVGVSQVSITNSQFACNQTNIQMGTEIGFLVTNNLFYIQSGQKGINVNGNNADMILTGNAFDFIGGAPSGIGIDIANNLSPSVVANNSCNNIATCIQIESTAQFVGLSNNRNNGGALLVNNSVSTSFQSSEGIWTPTLRGATTAGTPTYSGRAGAYHVDNRWVTVHFTVSTSALGGMAGDVQIGGLPFPASGTPGGLIWNCAITYQSGVTFAGQLSAVIPGAFSVATLAKISSGTTAYVDASSLAAATTLAGACSYQF